MSGRLFSIVCVAILAVGAGVVLATDDAPSFGYEATRDASGLMRLRILTDNAGEGSWLGITVYPAGVADVTRDSLSHVYPLKRGRSTTDLVVDPRYTNGTFEAAVWGKRLPQGECASTDLACQRLGYTLTGMRAYLWGHLTGTK
jgi:hypothetical protein